MKFNLYSQYYDLIYNSKNYSSETKKIADKISIEKPKILELGCGSGGHAEELSKLNCSITGLDLSDSMVQIANSKNIPNFRAIKADIVSFELNQKFDAVISMFHVISYLSTNEEVLNCFNCVAKHLQSGAPFIFDFWFSPAVFHNGFEHRVKTFSNDKITVVRESSALLDVNTNTAKVCFDIKVSDNKSDRNENIIEEHKMRFFSIPEIIIFAETSGFEVVEFFDLHSNQEPSLETWAITTKLQKK